MPPWPRVRGVVVSVGVIGASAFGISHLAQQRRLENLRALVFSRPLACPAQGRVAVLVGATGATGHHVLDRLLRSPEWNEVFVVGRRDPDFAGLSFEASSQRAKVREQSGAMDDASLGAFAKSWPSDAVLFNCLGTTRTAAGSAAAFRQVEVDISRRVALASRSAGIDHAIVVSAEGANAGFPAIDWLHPTVYIQTMGRKEGVMIESDFARVSVFRPGALDRRQFARPHELWLSRFTNALPVDVLAEAMVADAMGGGRRGVSKVDQEEPVYYVGNTEINFWGTT